MPLDALFDLLRFVVRGPAVADAIDDHAVDERLPRAGDRRLQQLRAQIAACPLVPMASSRDGLAAFEGHARPLELIAAPLSGRPVIGYRLRLNAVYADEGEERVTRQIVDVSSVQPFEIVESDTQRVARVSPDRCVPLLRPEPLVHLDLTDVIKPPLAPVLDRTCLLASDLVRAVDLRAVEHLLEPGEPVVAFGVARHEIDPGGAVVGYRDVPRTTTLHAPPDGVLVVADQHREVLLATLEQQWEILPSE